MFVTSPSLFHSRHFERPLSRGFGPNYIALGIHFGTHLEKNSVRFEESVLDRTLDPFWNCFFGFLVLPAPPRRNPFGSLFGSCCHPEAPWGWKFRILGGSGCRVFFWRDFTPQNGPSFSLNGCQNVFPKQYNLDQILSKEVSRNVLNETNSGK